MAATGKQMNWSAVAFTPVGGSLTPLNSIDGIDIDYGVTILGYSGDADIYHTLKVNNMNDPKMTCKTTNTSQLTQFSGVFGQFTAKHLDAKLASGGAVVYVLSNAIGGGVTVGGQHAAFGTGSITFEAYSSDGVTSPLSFTRV